MPYEPASSARAAGSGGTSPGGGATAVALAGVPAASVNLSKPAGVCTVRNRACELVTTKACGNCGGRSDPGYFSRLFSRAHGASPRQWRERGRL
ncbi:hypothetical protein B4U45_19230 [Mycobacterium persicum]|uniref:HTH araC/xylS-type domain-containing protein n=1 Tax=Mycobacterium persicum TaxID=1487726 RepID=A0A8E2LPP4_9MYCO|nr:AraC family transcriptional regulator [Mycobacterium persicum]ORB94584.1 hypothetical protein B1T44_08720 [Mycobacterium persicum]ORC08418.1 hypothetical protein B4U45_19230 [Mycobacterium persicum]VAZ72072.1 hypothetical protein LAUMK15_01146 [Mycobacterium persicum]VAZ88616.1 hypothetical protein LAUMK4_00792 [Mycobacterium persicum]